MTDTNYIPGRHINQAINLSDVLIHSVTSLRQWNIESVLICHTKLYMMKNGRTFSFLWYRWGILPHGRSTTDPTQGPSSPTHRPTVRTLDPGSFWKHNETVTAFWNFNPTYKIKDMFSINHSNSQQQQYSWWRPEKIGGVLQIDV